MPAMVLPMGLLALTVLVLLSLLAGFTFNPLLLWEETENKL